MPAAHRNILITGSSRGLGREMAEYYLKHGDHVYGCARSEASINHPNYHHYSLNIASAEEVSEFFFSLRKDIRQLDALINNAGVASMNAFALSPVESFQKIFDINVQGTFLFCQKALGLLKRAPAPRIINMTTVAVPLLLEGEAIYAASKSAVETLTRIIAKEYGGFGITCNAICPGFVDTPLAEAAVAGVMKARNVDEQTATKIVVSGNPVGRMIAVDEVASAAIYLASQGAAMVNGHALTVSGGEI